MNANEFQLRDNTGRELAVYDMNTGRVKYFNLYGIGGLGRAEAEWDSTWIQDPKSQNPGYWSYSRTDSRYYYIKDHLGSIRVTFDETGGVVNAQDYYSFGGILRSYVTGGLNGGRYKFTGKERDTETNYDYFGARYYDSSLGRWLTPDPLADKYPGWSPYNYCFNNPLKLIDPDGNDPTLVGAAAAAVVAGAALGVGITLYATYEVTKKYLEQPSSVNLPNQSTVIGVALVYTNSLYNEVSSWFSSDENSVGSGSSGASQKNAGSVDWSNPPSPESLGEEWKETTSDKNKTGNYKEYTNSKTGEKIRVDKAVPGAKGYKGKDHYHRYNPNSTGKEDRYLDEKGNPVPDGSSASHINFN